MLFGLIPKILNSIDMIMSLAKEFTMVDAVVLKLIYIKYIVASKCVRINTLSGTTLSWIIGNKVQDLASGIIFV